MNKIMISMIINYFILFLCLSLPTSVFCAIGKFGRRLGTATQKTGKELGLQPTKQQFQSQQEIQIQQGKLPASSSIFPGGTPINPKIYRGTPSSYTPSSSSYSPFPQSHQQAIPVTPINSKITQLVGQLQKSSTKSLSEKLLQQAAQEAHKENTQLAFITQELSDRTDDIIKKLNIVDYAQIHGGYLAKVIAKNDSTNILVYAQSGSDATLLQKTVRSPIPLEIVSTKTQKILENAAQEAELQKQKEIAQAENQQKIENAKKVEEAERNAKELKEKERIQQESEDNAEMEAILQKLEPEIEKTIVEVATEQIEQEITQREQRQKAFERKLEEIKTKYEQLESETTKQEEQNKIEINEKLNEIEQKKESTKTEIQKNMDQAIEQAEQEKQALLQKAETVIENAQKAKDATIQKIKNEETNELTSLEQQKNDFLTQQKNEATKRRQDLATMESDSLIAGKEALKAQQDLADTKVAHDLSLNNLQQAKSNLQLKQKQLEKNIQEIQELEKEAQQIALRKKEIEQQKKESEISFTQEKARIETDAERELKEQQQKTVAALEQKKIELNEKITEKELLQDTITAEELSLQNLNQDLAIKQQLTKTTQSQLAQSQNEIIQARKELEELQSPKSKELIDQAKNQITRKAQEAEEKALEEFTLQEQKMEQERDANLKKLETEKDAAAKKINQQYNEELALIEKDEQQLLTEQNNKANQLKKMRETSKKELEKAQEELFKAEDELKQIQLKEAERSAKLKAKLELTTTPIKKELNKQQEIDDQKSKEVTEKIAEQLKATKKTTLQQPSFLEIESTSTIKTEEPIKKIRKLDINGDGDLDDGDITEEDEEKPKPKSKIRPPLRPKKSIPPIIKIPPLYSIIDEPTEIIIPEPIDDKLTEIISEAPYSIPNISPRAEYFPTTSSTPSIKTAPLYNRNVTSMPTYYQPYYGQSLTPSFTGSKLPSAPPSKRPKAMTSSLFSPTPNYSSIPENQNNSLTGDQRAGDLSPSYESYIYEIPKPIETTKPKKIEKPVITQQEQTIIPEIEEHPKLKAKRIDLPKKEPIAKIPSKQEIHWFWRIITAIKEYIQSFFY